MEREKDLTDEFKYQEIFTKNFKEAVDDIVCNKDFSESSFC
jgi:hypothetical protein